MYVWFVLSKTELNINVGSKYKVILHTFYFFVNILGKLTLSSVVLYSILIEYPKTAVVVIWNVLIDDESSLNENSFGEIRILNNFYLMINSMAASINPYNINSVPKTLIKTL